MIPKILLFSVAYLIGSIPTGYWLGKVWKGIDIRQHGSGNVGATNVFRVLGAGPGLVTLLIDILKGWVCVYVCLKGIVTMAYTPILTATITIGPCDIPGFCGTTSVMMNPLVLATLAGLTAILGHCTSPFVGFKGGKGVATSAGVFLALMPIPGLIALGIFLLSLAATRIVSISSILAALGLAVSAWCLTRPMVFDDAATVVAALILYKHRSNIHRLLKGTEPRLYGR